jgi:hypothetical protein
MKRMIPYESTLERDAIYLFEFSASVIEYHGQPCYIHFYLDGEPSRYIPDFELLMADESQIHIEVKPESRLSKPEVARRFEAITAYYRSQENGFAILTESKIRRSPRLQNLELLAYHRGDADDPELHSAMRKYRLLPAETLGGVVAVVGDLRIVYRLLSAGLLECDLDQPLIDSAAVWFPGKEANHAALFD